VETYHPNQHPALPPHDRIADDDMGVWIDAISILYHSEI
jgi:hypothetical protein